MEHCQEHSGIVEKIRILCKWREDMTDSDGTIEHLWNAIGKKASVSLMVTVIVIVIGLMGTLFGLVYMSNETIIKEFGAIQTDIAVIKEKVK